MKNILFSVVVVSASLVAQALTWTGLDDTHKLGGRKVSDGYLKDKVVLTCRSKGLAPRMEEIWTSFKTKPFVLLGIFEAAEPGVTFAMYADVDVDVPDVQAPLCVIDETGHVYYKGSDDRKATEAVVTALTDGSAPKTLTQWKRLLDYEIENLPGHAYLRMAAFKKKFPLQAKDYAVVEKELAAVAGVKKIAELVKAARELKDPPVVSPKKAKIFKDKLASKIKSTMSKYKNLRESVDDRVKQEAKNALADLQWTLVAL